MARWGERGGAGNAEGGIYQSGCEWRGGRGESERQHEKLDRVGRELEDEDIAVRPSQGNIKLVVIFGGRVRGVVCGNNKKWFQLEGFIQSSAVLSRELGTRKMNSSFEICPNNNA